MVGSVAASTARERERQAEAEVLRSKHHAAAVNLARVHPPPHTHTCHGYRHMIYWYAIFRYRHIAIPHPA